MTLAVGRTEDATLTSAPLAPLFGRPRAFIVPRPFRRAARVVGDLLGAVAIVLCIPFVIVAIGIPIALFVGMLLRIGALLAAIGTG